MTSVKEGYDIGESGGWCRCLTANPTVGIPKVVDCRQKLAEIRNAIWYKEHKDLYSSGRRDPTFCVVVCIALRVDQ
jgi:phage terminase large subunit-like protein